MTAAPYEPVILMHHGPILIPLTTTGTLYVGPLIARGSCCDPITVRIHGLMSFFSSCVSLALIRLVASCLFETLHCLETHLPICPIKGFSTSHV